MLGYQPCIDFGEDMAKNVAAFPMCGDEIAPVTFVESFAHGGPALEFAIGTEDSLTLAAREARGCLTDGVENHAPPKTLHPRRLCRQSEPCLPLFVCSKTHPEWTKG
jgi:hypothetical protein